MAAQGKIYRFPPIILGHALVAAQGKIYRFLLIIPGHALVAAQGKVKCDRPRCSLVGFTLSKILMGAFG